MTCSVCNQEAECRVRTDQCAYGPIDVVTCERCHNKEMADVRAESKRVGFKLRTVSWAKLTKRGFYTDLP